jgi:hypothetical protein
LEKSSVQGPGDIGAAAVSMPSPGSVTRQLLCHWVGGMNFSWSPVAVYWNLND